MIIPIYSLAASIVFCTIMCLSFFRQKRWLLYISGPLYTASSAAATSLIWQPVSPAASATIILITLVVPALALLLFLADFLLAIFCLEMRYLIILWWTMAPLAVPLNLIGLAIR